MFLKARHSRRAVLERELSEAGSRAAETIGELAEHALAAAREAGHAATPAIQHSADGIGKALEKAAEALADTGERFARTGEHRAAEAAEAARARLADASAKFAESIRPKKKHHRVRNVLIAGAVIGGIVALVQSPLRAKVTERIFGPTPDNGPESIQLPGTESSTYTPAPIPDEIEPAAPAEGSVEGNGVGSTTASRDTAQS